MLGLGPHTAHVSSASWQTAFLQGTFPGATSSNGPLAQCEGLFWGGRSRPASVSKQAPGYFRISG